MSLSTAQTAVSTPKKSTEAPVTESPGTWRHPRLPEIIRRQEATNFGEKNIRRIAINVAVFVGTIVAHALLTRLLPPKKAFPYLVWYYSRCAYWVVLSIPLLNIAVNCLPLVRPKDDLSDIPLTPGQRRLLGLPPSSAPPTPGSAFSTPPRYSRTPSISGSAGSRRSFSTSPLSNRSISSNFGSSGTLTGNGSLNASYLGLGSPGSPLLQKAMNGARRSSFSNSLASSTASASIMNASTSSSFWGGVPDSPSPSPSKRINTLGLNNKWLYERGRDRRSSANAWLQN
ncbi:NPCC-domain-containing protein [Durotheca rogersii]|uniref:NPCC-domain-containing protein n=1 Tax=Durotheca rogersii TaxID=419775 RepID=UPI00221F6824|nr:NPCC-domain-containing protein [Durotheca rogersii]KAI5867254.1 NPCC-domain-containing protein [Durotheca rogersii]